jgi:hypothetical protein
MSRLCCGTLLFIACWSQPASGDERILFGADGSVVCPLLNGCSGQPPMRFEFGLPKMPATRMWRDGEVLRAVWVTNGVVYTETAFVGFVQLNSEEPGAAARSSPVLLVNIRGENTNSEYSEAHSELAFETGGKRQQLELKNGFLWRTGDERRLLVGALEIPAPGVKIPQGEVLRFEGNMPPSEKGSMTLKISVEALQGENAADRLSEVEFEAELRRALKSPGKTPAVPSHARLVFAHEDRESEAKREIGGTSGVSSNPGSYFPPLESKGGWRKLEHKEELSRPGGVDAGKIEDLKQSPAVLDR